MERHDQDEALAKAWRDCRRKAMYRMETHGEDLLLPAGCPFTLDRILNRRLVPQAVFVSGASCGAGVTGRVSAPYSSVAPIS